MGAQMLVATLVAAFIASLVIVCCNYCVAPICIGQVLLTILLYEASAHKTSQFKMCMVNISYFIVISFIVQCALTVIQCKESKLLRV